MADEAPTLASFEDLKAREQAWDALTSELLEDISYGREHEASLAAVWKACVKLAQTNGVGECVCCS